MPRRLSPGLTRRQRYWRDHLVACGKSGRRLSEYASTHGLELQQLYNWKTQLKGRGLLAGPSSKPRDLQGRTTPGQRHALGERRAQARFTAVQVAGGEVPSSRLRIRFPNGVMVEGAGFASADRDLLSYLAGLP